MGDSDDEDCYYDDEIYDAALDEAIHGTHDMAEFDNSRDQQMDQDDEGDQDE